MMLEDPALGGLARPDPEDGAFAEAVTQAIKDDVCPALGVYSGEHPWIPYLVGHQ
jgi:hypothetical protein